MAFLRTKASIRPKGRQDTAANSVTDERSTSLPQDRKIKKNVSWKEDLVPNDSDTFASSMSTCSPASLEESEEEHRSLELSYISLKLDFADTKTELDLHRHRSQKLDESNSSMQKQIDELLAERDAMRQKSKELSTIIHHLQHNAKQSSVERAELRVMAEAAMVERDVLKKDVAKLKLDNERLMMESHEMSAMLEHCQVETERLVKEKNVLQDSYSSLTTDDKKKNNNLFGLLHRSFHRSENVAKISLNEEEEEEYEEEEYSSGTSNDNFKRETSMEKGRGRSFHVGGRRYLTDFDYSDEEEDRSYEENIKSQMEEAAASVSADCDDEDAQSIHDDIIDGTSSDEDGNKIEASTFRANLDHSLTLSKVFPNALVA